MSAVIDCDVHPTITGGIEAVFPYLSSAWRKRLDDRKKMDLMIGFPYRSPHFRAEGGNRLESIPPSGGVPASDPSWVSQDLLDAHGIDIALLLPLQPACLERNLDAHEAAALVAAYNDYVWDHWLSADQRFRQAMVVTPQDPLLAASEVRRFGLRDGVVAVWVPTLNILLGNRYYDPIFQACHELGLPIVIHDNGSRGHFIGSPEFAGGNPTTQVERYTGLFQFGMAHVASLIWEGTFERYPQMKVVSIEYGWSWVPALLWRMDAAWKAARPAVPWVKRAPTEYVLDHIRFTSEPAVEPPSDEFAQQVLEQMHASRTLLFSTDYPHWDSDDPETVFQKCSPELRARIFRENAIQTFGERLMTNAVQSPAGESGSVVSRSNIATSV